VVKNSQSKGAPEGGQPKPQSHSIYTPICSENIANWVIISFILNPNIFTDFSTRIGTYMYDICVLDDVGVLG